MRFLFKILIMTLPLLAGISVHAETFLVPGDVNSSGITVSTPAKGMTMQQVEERFGSPQKKLPATGNPPITRWIYDNYTVYFERQYVIHSVVHH